MNETTLLFNLKNLLYWTILCISIYIEIRIVRANPDRWPEKSRWRLGYLTLFGSGLAMVLWAQYHFWTWLVFAVLALVFNKARIERILVGILWDRADKEQHRWTCQYFTVVLAIIPGIVLGWLDIVTWGAMFAALGLCGASKVGWTAYLNSQAAKALRETSIIETGGIEWQKKYHKLTKIGFF